jgi:lysozyme
MADLKIGADGLAVVKAFESCMRAIKGRPGYFAAYYDPVNVLTIGWGHTNHHKPTFGANTVWSQAACDAVLAGDMVTFEKHVEKHAKVPLAQHEFDALVSWSYNTGGPSHATVWKRLNSGDKAGVPSALAAWNKAGGNVLKGLVRRRKSEGQLFAGDIKGALRTAQGKSNAGVIAGGTIVAGGAAAAASGDWSVALFVIGGALLVAAIAFIIIKNKRK